MTLTREQAMERLRRMPSDRRLFVPDVARITGLKETTITRYLFDARSRRSRSEARPRDLPEPDGHERGTADRPGALHTGGPPRPYWYPGTLREWIPARHFPGHARNDGRSPLPPGSPETARPLGRPPLPPGPKPRLAAIAPDAGQVDTGAGLRSA